MFDKTIWKPLRSFLFLYVSALSYSGRPSSILLKGYRNKKINACFSVKYCVSAQILSPFHHRASLLSISIHTKLKEKKHMYIRARVISERGLYYPAVMKEVAICKRKKVNKNGE